MSSVFINYRQGDSIATAGRLHDRLSRTLGRKNVFMDVQRIPAGVDFADYLDLQVRQSHVMLCLIGPHWLDMKDEQGKRRLEDPNDFVAFEIAAAMSHGIPVIPVLIDGARMPTAERLPERLRQLPRQYGVELRNTQFESDVERLSEKIVTSLGKGPFWRRPLSLLALTAVLVGVSVAAYIQYGPPISAAPTSPPVALPSSPPAKEPAQPLPTAMATPPPTPAQPAENPTASARIVPAVSVYCSDLKEIVAAHRNRFDGLLGRKFGDNRIARVPLSEWEDCLVWMEGRFVDTRRYTCRLSGIAGRAEAERLIEATARAMQEQCLGSDWSVSTSYDTDRARRTRLVSRTSEATITLRPDSDPLSPLSWRLVIDVE